jgi:hypothetical protein
MGDLRPNNGGDTPPEDGGGARPGGLPDFPPEWGTIVIPDDASELHQEAAAIRRELRRRSRRDRLRTAFGLGPAGRDTPSLGVPVIIMAVAVITTLLSLFVVTWDRRPTTPLQGPAGGGSGSATLTPLTDTVLADASGTRVRLGGLLPAVLLLTGDCDCAALLSAIAAAAPAPVTIVPIGHNAPCPVATAPNIRCLADPDAAVTSRYATLPTVSPAVSVALSPSAPPTVTAVVMDATGMPANPLTVDSADDLSAAFSRLA